jgi:hypothetical protein
LVTDVSGQPKGLIFNGQAVQDRFFSECVKVQEISDILLNVLLRIYFNCECSVMVVMVLLCYHVKTSSFILEINILDLLFFLPHCGNITVWILGKQRLFYRSVNGRMLRTSAARDAKVFFCLDDTCER